MRGRRLRITWMAAIALLAVYGTSYAVMRSQRTLVRTGWLHNVRDATTGELAPSGGWRDNGVRGDTRVPGVKVYEFAFWPLIQAESLFWNTIGSRLRT